VSAILDRGLTAEQLADCEANDRQLSDWSRQMAADIARAHPLTPSVRVRATGNHLVAQNDEPEPIKEEA
jgi:hypothetical protein